jgi:hypothetical protein
MRLVSEWSFERLNRLGVECGPARAECPGQLDVMERSEQSVTASNRATYCAAMHGTRPTRTRASLCRVKAFSHSGNPPSSGYGPTLPAPLFGRVALPDSRRRFAVIFHREFREKASVNWGFVDGAHRRLGLKLQNSLYFSLIAGRRVRSRPLPPPVQFREGSPARSCSAESRNICGHS